MTDSIWGRRILGVLVTLGSLDISAGNIWAQQILLGPDRQPVRQPFYQAQDYVQPQTTVQPQDHNSIWLLCLVIAVLFVVGLGLYWAYKKEKVFFNDQTDMWISISAVVLEGFLLFTHNSLFIICGLVGIITYHSYCAYRFNLGNIAEVLVMAISRIVIGVVIPVLAFIILFIGNFRQKDESAESSAMNSAIHAAAKAAMLAGFFIFMRSLVNGEEVLRRRRESKKERASGPKTDRQSSSYSRTYSKEQSSSGTSYKQQSYKQQSSTNNQSGFKTASQEEPSDYDILGVPKTASFRDIHRAYRAKMLKTHPDRMAGMGARCRQMAEEECKKINAAFDRIRKARNYAFA